MKVFKKTFFERLCQFCHTEQRITEALNGEEMSDHGECWEVNFRARIPNNSSAENTRLSNIASAINTLHYGTPAFRKYALKYEELKKHIRDKEDLRKKAKALKILKKEFEDIDKKL